MKRIFVWPLLFVCLCLCNSCAPPPSSPFAAEGAFSAEIVGTLAGEELSAVIHASQKADTGEREVGVCFLSPSAWKGMAIRAVIRSDGELGEAQVTLGERSVPTEGGRVAGLLSPVLILLDASEAATVQKQGEEYLLTLGDGAQFWLDVEGRPKRYESESVSFSVVWWEAAGPWKEKG